MPAHTKARFNMNPSGIVVRTWNDAPISRRDSDGFADATAMCQANGKRWHDYERLDRTADYMKALAASTGLTPEQLVITTTTGPNHLRGTWIHPRLAVDLARWLSPDFAVWMDGWFLEQAQAPQAAAGLSADEVVQITTTTVQQLLSRQPKPRSTRRAQHSTIQLHFEQAESTDHAIVAVLAEAHANGAQRLTTRRLVEEVQRRFGRARGSIFNALTRMQRDHLVVRPRPGMVRLSKPETVVAGMSPLQPAAPGTISGRLVLMDLIYRLAVAAGHAIGWADIRQHLSPEQTTAIGLQQVVEAMESLQALDAGHITTDNGIAFKAGKDIARLPWLMA